MKRNKTQANRLLLRVVLGSLLVSTAHASTSLYDQLHPYYVQFCAVTQLKPLDGTNGGGTGGHGVLFLKGVCRDQSVAYPRLKLCDEDSIDLSNPEAGTSISVDQIFENANWVALDGKDLLITGGLPESERLDKTAQEKLIQRVISLNLFKGIKIHPQYMKDKPARMSDDEYLARQTLATEFALNFGRNVYCSRIPVQREMLSPMIAHLNSLNDYYQNTGDYEWSGVYNNCTHTTHNALAAAGVERPYGTDEFIAKQVFNLAVPSNEYIDLERLGNDESLDDVVEFYKDPVKRKVLLERGWMATEPGVLTDNHLMHRNNALYDTHSDFFVLDFPGLSPQRKEFDRINHEARYSDIRENLLYFKAKYEGALDSRMSIEDLRELVEARSSGDTAIAPPNLSTQEFERFYHAYYKKIESALSEVKATLSGLIK